MRSYCTFLGAFAAMALLLICRTASASEINFNVFNCNPHQHGPMEYFHPYCDGFVRLDDSSHELYKVEAYVDFVWVDRQLGDFGHNPGSLIWVYGKCMKSVDQPCCRVDNHTSTVTNEAYRTGPVFVTSGNVTWVP